MKLGSPALIAAGVLAGLLFAGLSGPPQARSNVHSPAALALAPDGKVLYVADQTMSNVAIVDGATGKVVGTVGVADPRGLALSADGQTLHANSGERDEVCKIDTAARRVVARAETRRQPPGLCLSPDGQSLYCCNQFTDDVTVHDAATLKRTARILMIAETYSGQYVYTPNPATGTGTIGSWQPLPGATRPDGVAAGPERHNVGTNVVWFDGHVKWYNANGEIKTKATLYNNTLP